jgi:hemoglobin
MQHSGNAPHENVSLYDRLGGVYSIAAIVENFIDRILIDPRLNANPRVREGHRRVPSAGFKYTVTEYLCSVTGGPQRYSGRSMGDAHRHLIVTGAEWEAFMEDLRCSLEAFDVPRAEQEELKAILESRKDEIVIRASHE